MKKLLFVIGMLVCIQAYPQKDTALTAREVYNDAKVGIKEVIGGVKELAGKLEGPAKHVYGIYVRQHMIEGIAFGCICLFFWIVGMIMISKNFKDATFDGDIKWQEIMLIIGTIIILFAIIWTWLFFGDDGFSKILNPEYFAIQDIIKTFK